MLEGPESPRSVYTSLSCSPPMLDPGTQSILHSFLSERDQERALFSQLTQQTIATRGFIDPGEVLADEDDEVPPMLNVDDYRVAFGEDWQLSQFWYSTAFATRLAQSIRSITRPSDNIAFLCCPTAFVAFQHEYSSKNARLLEFDKRFSVLDPKRFIPYDESLRGTVDVAVVDPPFLNEVTNKNLATTLRQILNPKRGKLVMITSTSVENVLDEVYSQPPLGALRRAVLEVEHGQLANDFACWGSWDGAERFGSLDELDLTLS
ncbi:n-6 adenine-specific dna methyltransferase 2 [Moniliophthora roreri MCA 2997]|uniref:N-6 adenine-specific dna methyltransferase 2 n=1 Tax=Moniliophthora roreri (strain MCA 2997) TaxID=1381753 RepID=V2W665_MONRO|nr:n-6 adenine-specific dna methyltransferase 2 [Moniliophthora roreri MCA 2997]